MPSTARCRRKDSRPFITVDSASELGSYHSAALANTYVNDSVVIFVEGRAGIAVDDAFCVCKLDFEHTGFQRLDGIGKSSTRSKGVFAKRGGRIVDDDGLHRFGTDVDKVDLDDVGAASGQSGHQQQCNRNS